MKRVLALFAVLMLVWGTSAMAETYTASAAGLNGDVKIVATITEGQITAIEVQESSETAGIGDVAMEKLIAAVVENQSLNLDVVAGATFSSNALLLAVEDCLTQAGCDVEAFKMAAAAPEAPQAQAEVKTLETEFVVIGGGPAGVTAAVAAAERGVKVMLFEKMSATGGAAARGMGILAIGTHVQEAQGEMMDVDEAYEMFMEYTHFRTDGVLVREYFERSNETLEWIEDMGVEFEEAARYFTKSYPSWHIVKSDDGTKGGGQAATMMRRLTERAEALGVEIYLDTPATAVKLDAEGKVCGVTARTTDGTVEYDVACSAAIIATGGFGDDVERIQEELGYTYGEDFFGMRLPGHDGDGIDMAWAVGAGRSDFNIEMIFDIFRPGSVGRAGSDVGLIMKQPNLLVNLNGERFFNEEHVENTTYCGNALAQQENNQGFMILDESIKNEYVEANSVPFTSRVGMVSDFSNFDANLENAINSGYTAIVKADTVEELADKMGINRENLLNTVAAYNEICASGKDPLGKDAQFLKPIDEGPFYAASYFPSSYGTLGGIKINSELEVLTHTGEVIPGLYSAGTDSCTVYGDSYMFLLPGNTMGYSVNTGRFAGENAAAYLGK